MTAPVVFVSIDTEEDDWGQYARRMPGVTNIRQLLEFQDLCDRYGARPSYLVNWPVVAGDSSRDIIRELLSHGKCEVGTHIHPWNTPPHVEEPIPQNSFVCNLPEALGEKKLSSLHALSIDRLGQPPRTFRAGRWGFGPTVARVLVKLGYQVDSSVSPMTDWTAQSGPDYRRAPSSAYRFHPEEPLVPRVGGELVEIPVTIGFIGKRPRLAGALRQWALRPLPRRLRMVGALDRLGLARKRWLSPEQASGREMVSLARSLVASGARFLNLTFHSPTLVPGLTPFVQTERERRDFMAAIERFLDFAQSSGFRFYPLGRGPEVLGLSEDATSLPR